MPSRTIRLAVLECDTPVPAVHERLGTYGDIFTALLNSATDAVNAETQTQTQTEEGKVKLEISKYDVVQKMEYPRPEEVDAVLMTGSKHNSWEDLPWILQLVDYTTQLLKQDRVKIVGICFGHQIIGRALGVKVGPNEKGWEVAVNDVVLTEKGKEVLGLERLRLQQMHKDIVFAYPPSPSPLNPKATIERLGGNYYCENQAMYSPGHFISFQGHPEFTGMIVQEIVQCRWDGGVFTKEMCEDFMRKAGLEHDGGMVSRAVVRFLRE